MSAVIFQFVQFAILSIAFLLFCNGTLAAYQGKPNETGSTVPIQLPALNGGDETRPAESQSLDRLITQIVLDSIPHSYTDDKDWGKTAQRYNGVHFRREGWRIETKRDWTTVNHGLWKKTTTRLIDPEHRFSVELLNVRPHQDVGTAFDLVFTTPLAAEYRQSQWVQGVQLYSVSADIEATVRLALSCELAIELRWNDNPPVVIFQPKVTAADLQINDFVVKRVSKLGGEFAQQVTQLTQSQLSEQVDRFESKIVEKINRQLVKQADHFRVSLQEARESSWAKLLWPTLSEPSDTNAKGSDAASPSRSSDK